MPEQLAGRTPYYKAAKAEKSLKWKPGAPAPRRPRARRPARRAPAALSGAAAGVLAGQEANDQTWWHKMLLRVGPRSKRLIFSLLY